jgi:hypothetical protein
MLALVGDATLVVPCTLKVPTRRDLVKLALSTGAWLTGTSLGCSGKRRSERSGDDSGPRRDRKLGR